MHIFNFFCLQANNILLIVKKGNTKTVFSYLRETKAVITPDKTPITVPNITSIKKPSHDDIAPAIRQKSKKQKTVDKRPISPPFITTPSPFKLKKQPKNIEDNLIN